MLWVAAFLALIIWVLGLASNFLGFRIHLFLLFAIFCGLIAMLPARESADDAEETLSPDDPNAKSVPAARAETASAEAESPIDDQMTRPAAADEGEVSLRSRR